MCLIEYSDLVDAWLMTVEVMHCTLGSPEQLLVGPLRA